MMRKPRTIIEWLSHILWFLARSGPAPKHVATCSTFGKGMFCSNCSNPKVTVCRTIIYSMRVHIETPHADCRISNLPEISDLPELSAHYVVESRGSHRDSHPNLVLLEYASCLDDETKKQDCAVFSGSENIVR